MKKIFLFLFLIVFSTSSILAQPAKVLICAPGNLSAAKTTDSSLQKYYTDSIDLSDTITNGINNYEAVFLLLSSQRPLSKEDENHLKGYLNSKKNLYIEYNPGSFHDFHLDTNGFWGFVGLRGAVADNLFSSIAFVLGIKGTFTEGLSIANPQFDPHFAPYGGIWKLYGSIKQVLTTTPDVFGLAYTHETDSFKVVFHWPIIPDYYDAFLGRVICNYFGLCAPFSVAENNENTKSAYSVFPNPASDRFFVHKNTQNTGLQSVDLYSEAGTLVSRWSSLQQEDLHEFDLRSLHLTSGAYFLRLQNNKESIVQPVFLLSK
ncbi:MAG: T9SS type A sorting domain-containing protein [Candidatus Kapaibacterium sp.]